MLKGMFIRGDGLVIPNNITTFGAQTILNAAMANIDTDFYVGLVDGMPTGTLQIESLEEPTIGLNGYARKEIARSSVGWPTSGDTNGEAYIESGFVTWIATGGNFDVAIRRMMLVTSSGATTGDVIALSAALPEAYTITPATAEELRKFKYRVYLR